MREVPFTSTLVAKENIFAILGRFNEYLIVVLEQVCEAVCFSFFCEQVLIIIYQQGALPDAVDIVSSILVGVSSILETSSEKAVLEAVNQLIRNAQVFFFFRI